MAGKRLAKADELKKLIREQEKDRESKYVFSERVNPRKQTSFSNLPLRERTVFILSFFMSRKDIAQSLRLSPGSVSQYHRRAQAKLSDDDRERLNMIRDGFVG